ncbi:TCB1 [Hepatospora eriocheir]|uniref:TCB1 n=1 Tax=Hepatospora eriocheir TaxID=1081669 RepID=A0A1X0QFN5_9MICR|nr:TCB1 [Hepatospora eriocheir]
MTGAAYKQILAKNLRQSANEMGIDSFIFMHDNDPKHTSGVVKDWIDAKEIDILPWPPQSPDLNPIEHIRAYIKKELCKKGKLKKQELKKEILRIWNSITPKMVQPYIMSFNKRVLAIYNAKGKHVDY